MPPVISPLLAAAGISWTVTILAVIFVGVSLLMMFIILIQKPKGGGLSGAFGGAGGGESSFVGAKVGDVLTLATVIFFVFFIGLAMLLTWNINPTQNQAQADVPTASAATDTDATDDADSAATPSSDESAAPAPDASDSDNPQADGDTNPEDNATGDAAASEADASSNPD